jgi:hypothetical protein
VIWPSRYDRQGNPHKHIQMSSGAVPDGNPAF